jgi:hypothetical protein
MAVVQPPTWTEYGVYSSRSDRLNNRGLIDAHGATSTGAFLISAITPTPLMKVTVGAGTCWIDASGFEVANGFYHLVNDGTITLDIAPSDPTFPRIDLIIARVYDSFYEGSQTKGEIEVLRGDPAVSPVAKPLPAASFEIGRITVGAGVSSITAGVINNATMPIARIRESLIYGSGTWTSYTPTFSNFIVGASSITARYTKLGKTVHYAGLVTLGTGFSMNGSPLTVSLPAAVTGAYNTILAALGVSMINDNGSGTYMGMPTVSTGTSFMIRTYAGAAISISTPFAWAVGDSFSWNITYETTA